MKKKIKVKVKVKKDCTNCAHFKYLCEGYYICDYQISDFVNILTVDFEPNEYYFWFCGSKWIEVN